MLARCLAVLAALTVLSAWSIVPAGAHQRGGGTSCDANANTATFFRDEPGDALRVSASYNENFMGGDKIASSYRGKDTFGAGSCTDPDPFASATILLGDRDDRARLDGTRPNFDSQAPDPIPSFVAITIDAGPGNDELLGHQGLDRMLGRGGADEIDVAGGDADEVNCGPGKDAVRMNGADTEKNCEKRL